jgi:serine/threonine protein kinase
VIGDHWTLERVLGTGATATVYAARNPSGARAAVKILNPEMRGRPEVRERFLREREAASSINHPGVVQVVQQASIEAGEAYLVMELLEGQTLAERAQRSGPPPLPELLGLVDQVLDVLAVAHDAGVVHRDLKPANLFVTEQGQVKLLDFGVARLVEPGAQSTTTRLGVTLGTSAYMSPEQAQGKSAEVDGRSDLFAVGAVMFRLLTGRRVHEGQTDSELAAAMATRPAPPTASVAAGLPADVCSIIDIALSFSKDARYPDARTMQTDVRAVLAGQTPPHATGVLGARQRDTLVGARPTSLNPASPNSTDASGSPAATEKQESLEGQLVAERYQIEKLLGSGGMGSVYRGTHVHMRKAVAVKVLHREMTSLPEVVARFEREAVAAAKIEHPNVAAATDFGQLPDGSFYLILEFVEGRSLSSELDAHGAMAAPRALHITAQIVRALAAAHACKIVHRDLKPDNVMLVDRQGDSDFVKVLDFGIAKLSVEDTGGGPALTQIGSVFGTPEYMSPEQAKGEPVDARSDLYAVGVLLYEMLSGHTPFANDETLAVLTAHLTQPPPPLPAGIDPRVAELVMMQLAKDPAQRIQTAEQLLERIEVLLGVGQAPVPAQAASGLRAGPTSARRGDATVWSAQAAPARGGAAVATTLPDPGSGPPTAGPEPSGLPSVVEALARRVPGLRGQVRIGGQPVPVWVIATAAVASGFFAALLVTVVLVAGGGPVEPSAFFDSSQRARAADAAAAGSEQAADELARRAARGDRDALSRLQKVPDAERSLRDWRALGRGYATIQDYRTSMAAYARALKLDRSLAGDRRLLADVRRALAVVGSHDAALALCKNALGSAGADLLFDLWAKERRNPNRKQYAEAARIALEEQEVRSRASPALSIALALQAARGCSAHKRLLARAAEHADARSEPYLRRLQARRGCGFLGLGDCYSCVRGDPNLGRALKRAADHPAPSYATAPPQRNSSER